MPYLLILEFFWLIEWMMTLPPPLQLEFKTELNRIQEENPIPFMTRDKGQMTNDQGQRTNYK
ncbi:MAG TPA: hypothetical protein IGS52_17835 [Oscillatoriaceae cyanobacterium M33_DOE_052]|uniref:Uncharacterized protein n=1 Tax=Planktothricoides sp. SpSt-374 TaxID=2282167 RepID=A0A7C3VFQ6_9CYAN|nr:hypothetical protein [Oscillatoriaceae cyanobacterium M33_DOE_052]